mmetsp:Transcript_5425/g.13651  ORF Transcript_5425/g.13651 Transcript_5425/m.13651 type:complete len:260 (-) Transcript_5425:110-889(-)
MIHKHLVGKVHRSVTGRLRTDQTSTPVRMLASENTHKAVGKLFILRLEIANLTTTNTNITSRNICVRSNMTKEFTHERLTEGHDVTVTPTTRVKVRTAFRTTHGQSCERVLENLLKAKELENTEVHRWMETKSTLVGSNGRVVLDAIATVHLFTPLLIDPANTKLNDTLRLHESRHHRNVLGISFKDRCEALQHLFESLQELDLPRVTLACDRHQTRNRIGLRGAAAGGILVDGSGRHGDRQQDDRIREIENLLLGCGM